MLADAETTAQPRVRRQRLSWSQQEWDAVQELGQPGYEDHFSRITVSGLGRALGGSSSARIQGTQKQHTGNERHTRNGSGVRAGGAGMRFPLQVTGYSRVTGYSFYSRADLLECAVSHAEHLCVAFKLLRECVKPALIIRKVREP